MSVLVIDDEEGLRRSLCAYLEDMDYDPLEAADGRQGLEVLAASLPHVEAVIVDLNMPVMDGYAFLARARELSPDLPTIVLSGVGLVEDAIRAMRAGAWDFITKPLRDFGILQLTLDKVLERARLLRENRAYQQRLECMVGERTAEIERTRRQILQRLSRAAEYKDNETGMHVIRVGEISALLGQVLGLSQERCDMLRQCAPLHDVGKIGIPDNILLKPAALDAGEWDLMRRHCAFGCELLGPLDRDDARASCASYLLPRGDDGNPFLALARMLALLHHERWDGTGYPFGLRGDDVPMEARIVALVDVYDALRSERPYKRCFTREECRDAIVAGSGTQFDPDVVRAFLGNLDAIEGIRARWVG
ncbi:HD domain-containing phosphohydrolase [Nitratidesulfovibrio liaohensis]|uniref:Response regulator n=1 Tax=Nitratidesulfovibrio liaohensis TaxID=2604158 RepID=A0ABY9R2D3_9BACT|nr:HD domain-containing phosphohydrolase [Nitratidesulfovibrio liaohensis]WMW64725.1 response regulator [Nitratidesulfovibrio liaohensis]